mmetsp:Transcript_39038/g.112140  ORF Transcript_39038/g.112140 Transcript_39038/m.112140 type:complete len:251 (+) Transcript_39038:308-1060(+)
MAVCGPRAHRRSRSGDGPQGLHSPRRLHEVRREFLGARPELNQRPDRLKDSLHIAASMGILTFTPPPSIHRAIVVVRQAAALLMRTRQRRGAPALAIVTGPKLWTCHLLVRQAFQEAHDSQQLPAAHQARLPRRFAVYKLAEHIHGFLALHTAATASAARLAGHRQRVIEIVEQGYVQGSAAIHVDQVEGHVLGRGPPSGDPIVLSAHGLREHRHQVPVPHLACEVQRCESQMAISRHPGANLRQNGDEL